jgi:S-DNA-T family DNA segregation ATPase FtsK/SpoIIIE
VNRPKRATRSTPKARPVQQRRQLTPKQQRELAGLVIAGIGLLSLLAMVHASGSALDSLAGVVWDAFGFGWPLAVGGAIAGGALLVWPKAPALPRTQVGAGVLAGLVLLALLSLVSGPAGGAVGRLILALVPPVGGLGSLLILLTLFVGSIVVAASISVGKVISAVVPRRRFGGVAPGHLFGWLVRQEPVIAPAPTAPPASAPRVPPTALPRPARDMPVAGPGPQPVAAQPAGDADQVLLDPAVAAEHTPVPDGGEGVVGDDDADWNLPPLDLLNGPRPRRGRREREADASAAARTIEGTLATFGVQARVIGVNVGPAVTQYEVQPAAGVPVRKVVSLHNDLALALAAAPLRMEAPIPGKQAIGIEVPNKVPTFVTIREGVEAAAFQSGRHRLGVVLGNDVAGMPISADLTRMPHLLIAGATGQGKSVCLNTLICSLLLGFDPTQLRMVMIDPKRVELQGYDGLPHLAVPVIVEPAEAAAALRWAVEEMERRYKLLQAAGVRDIASLNARVNSAAETLAYVVVVIDELADLMMVAAGEIEELICRIAQKARAVGIHLVIATQRPSRDIITGLIAANVPSRIVFAVGSQVDSRVALDMVGAEKLIGQGDMLYKPVGSNRPLRLQGAFISDQEVEDLVAFWKAQGEPRYFEGVLDTTAGTSASAGGSDRQLDPLFARAARAVAADGSASVAMIQRKFNVGYSRAGRLVDALAEHRVIGPYQGSKSREVLMSLPDVDELLERLGVEGEAAG